MAKLEDFRHVFQLRLRYLQSALEHFSITPIKKLQKMNYLWGINLILNYLLQEQE